MHGIDQQTTKEKSYKLFHRKTKVKVGVFAEERWIN